MASKDCIRTPLVVHIPDTVIDVVASHDDDHDDDDDDDAVGSSPRTETRKRQPPTRLQLLVPLSQLGMLLLPLRHRQSHHRRQDNSRRRHRNRHRRLLHLRLLFLTITTTAIASTAISSAHSSFSCCDLRHVLCHGSEEQVPLEGARNHRWCVMDLAHDDAI